MVMSSLKNTAAGLVLAVSAIAATSSLATAGGDAPGYGAALGRARSAEAIPVPAPVPVPTTETGYYLRLDAAYSQSNLSKYQGSDPFGNQVRGDSYLDNFPRFGFGAGYQFTRWFRMDATLDWRNDVHSKGAGNRDYTIANGLGGTNTTIAMRDTYSDGFTSSNMTGLVNAYLDAPISPSFTPYVGVGLGFVRHQLKGRSFSRTTTCVDAFDCDPAAGGDNAVSLAANSSTSALAGGTDYSLAAAAMVGFTYKVWENTKLDLGYRFLHLAGTSFTGRNASTVENLKIPDQNIHEMRVGLRYDIN
jgi:opacity protein-like surface antigen